jgi:TonB family protein
MKKELLFSFIGHLVLFLILASVAKPQKRDNLYPEIFQVSVVNFESGSPTTTQTSAVSIVEKKPKVDKPKVVKENKKPTQQTKTGKSGNNLGLKISSKGGKHSYYIDAILSKIGSNWVNPFASSGVKFSTTIYFVIQKDGRITSVKIEKSSSNELYDRSAERAVIITQTLPPLAGEFAQEESLKLHLEFEYKP